jgi:threonine/homoserine/homoserine lactone efflux protein
MLENAGFELLPSAPLFLAFALAGLALNLVPGADMTFVIASAARSGARGGIVASLGVATGALGHTLLAVAGVSALIASSAALFGALKWIGSAYLLYLALQLVRSGRPRPLPKLPGASLAATFRGAAMVNLLNPKVALFFVAFLPQFIDPAAKSRALQLLALGIWFNLVGTLVNCLIGVAAAGAARNLRNIPRLAVFARWFAALTFIALALRLLLFDRPAPAVLQPVLAE